MVKFMIWVGIGLYVVPFVEKHVYALLERTRS